MVPEAEGGPEQPRLALAQAQLYLVVREPWAPGLNPAHPTSLERPPPSGWEALQPGQALPPGLGPALLPTKSSCSRVPGAVALAQDLAAWPGTPAFLAGHHESSAGAQGCWFTCCGRVGEGRGGDTAQFPGNGVWGGVSWEPRPGAGSWKVLCVVGWRGHTKDCDRKPHPEASSLTPCRN